MTALDQLQLIKLQDICQKKPLITIDAAASVDEALKKMKDQRIRCLAVLKSGTIMGILDIRNVMFYLAWGKFTVSLSDEDTAPQFSTKLDTSTVADLLGLGTPEGQRVWAFEGTDPVQVVIEPFAKGVHRAVVKVKGSLHLITQTDVARWVAINSAFVPILEKRLSDLGLASTSVIVCSPSTDLAIDAYRKAAQHQVSGVAVVDAKSGRLVANISGTDLRGLDSTTMSLLTKPTLQFLAEVHPQSLSPVIVHRDETLKAALFKLLSLKIHRVFCVDADLRPTAVITLGDILSKFCTYSPEMKELK